MSSMKKEPMIGRRRYPQITIGQEIAIFAFALRRARLVVVDPITEERELQLLIDRCIPYGSLVDAWTEWNHGVLRVGLKVQGVVSTVEQHNGTRYVEPEWFLTVLALSMFGGHSHIKDTSDRIDPAAGHPWDYVYIFEDAQGGIPWQRLIAGAGPGQHVKLGAEHKNLCRDNLTLTRSSQRAKSNREQAVNIAKRRYLDAAVKAAGEGTSLPFSEGAYEALLWLCFKLLDDAHAHRHKPKDEQPATIAATAAE